CERNAALAMARLPNTTRPKFTVRIAGPASVRDGAVANRPPDTRATDTPARWPAKVGPEKRLPANERILLPAPMERAPSPTPRPANPIPPMRPLKPPLWPPNAPTRAAPRPPKLPRAPAAKAAGGPPAAEAAEVATAAKAAMTTAEATSTGSRCEGRERNREQQHRGNGDAGLQHRPHASELSQFRFCDRRYRCERLRVAESS